MLPRRQLKANHWKYQNFYMDHILRGSDSFEETKSIINQTEKLLLWSQFPLDKWRTKGPLLFDYRADLNKHFKFNFNKTEGARVLGIAWDSSLDSFNFQIKSEIFARNTKRSGCSIHVGAVKDCLTNFPRKIQMVFSNLSRGHIHRVLYFSQIQRWSLL